MNASTEKYVKEVLATLSRVERVQGGWIACCPLHADRQRSLRIAEQGSRVFVRCASRCAARTVAAFIEALLAAPSPTLVPTPECDPFALPAVMIVEPTGVGAVSMAA